VRCRTASQIGLTEQTGTWRFSNLPSMTNETVDEPVTRWLFKYGIGRTLFLRIEGEIMQV